MPFRRSIFALAALAIPLFAQQPPAPPEDTPLNQRVLVVYNANSDNSHRVAKYYMEKRAIPKSNLCKIDTAVAGLPDGDHFDPEVKKPIRACLEKLGRQNILYIVLSFETPYTLNYGGRQLALDQLLADIWDEYAPAMATGRETGDQPYFGRAQSQGNVYEPFVSFAKYRARPNAKTIYSVWRLDGPTPAIAEGLVDKALDTEKNGLHGNAYFDTRVPIDRTADTGYGAGDWDIYRSSVMSQKAGFNVTLDDKETEFGTAPSLLHCDNAALYAGWYSLAHYNDAFTWVPGAIGFHLDSASATNPRGAQNWVGEALARGITVTSGAVTEPFLEGLVHPDQIFFYLFQGANVGDAVLRSTRWLKWMILNVGDPLYRPFPHGAGGYAGPPQPESWFAIAPPIIVGPGKMHSRFFIAGKHDKDVQVTFTSTDPQLISLPNPISLPPTATGGQLDSPVKAVDKPVNIIVFITAGDEKISNTLTVLPATPAASTQPTASGPPKH